MLLEVKLKVLKVINTQSDYNLLRITNIIYLYIDRFKHESQYNFNKCS